MQNKYLLVGTVDRCNPHCSLDMDFQHIHPHPLPTTALHCHHCTQNLLSVVWNCAIEPVREAKFTFMLPKVSSPKESSSHTWKVRADPWIWSSHSNQNVLRVYLRCSVVTVGSCKVNESAVRKKLGSVKASQSSSTSMACSTTFFFAPLTVTINMEKHNNTVRMFMVVCACWA